MRRSKSNSDVFHRRVGIIPWMHDQLYRFVHEEIGFALDFTADFFRPAHMQTKSAEARVHSIGKEKPPEAQLTHSEMQVFMGMLARRKDEDIITYWKRRKALMQYPDIKALVAEQMERVKKKKRHDMAVGITTVDTSLSLDQINRMRKAVQKSQKAKR